MTGKELSAWIEENNISICEAAVVLGISRQTLYRSLQSVMVSDKLSRQAAKYSLIRARNDLHAAMKRLNELTKKFEGI